jgi:hypothetical protein
MARKTKSKELVAQKDGNIVVGTTEDALLADGIDAMEAQEADTLNSENEVTTTETEKSIAVRTLIAAHNDALVAGSTALTATIKTTLDKAIKELNEEEKSVQLNGWADTEKPVLSCLTDGGTFGLTGIKTDKDTGMITLVGKSQIVDLKELFKVKMDAFVDRNWLAYAEAANIAIRDFIASVMNIRTMTEKLAGFKLTATAAMLGIGAKDMKTAKGCQAALQKVVNSIIEGYTVTVEDAEAFRYNYSQWGSKSITGVSLSMEATFRKTLTRILVKIVNKMEYVGE